MNKKIYILLLFLTGLVSKSQTKETKSGVEVKINIYQHFDLTDKMACSSMGVTISNYTGKKIYIPRLDNYTTPHIYKKVNNSFSERLFIRQGKIAEVIESRQDGLMIQYSNEMNEISEKFATINQEKYTTKLKNFEKECATSPEKLKKAKPFITDLMKYGGGFEGFLQPGEIIENCHVSDIPQFYSNTKGDYKIWIDVQEIKILDERMHLNYPYPAEFYHDIMGYELFLPENMTFNVVYITIL
jgi:hypothetical protein